VTQNDRGNRNRSQTIQGWNPLHGRMLTANQIGAEDLAK
jgi:hypothetical protein